MSDAFFFKKKERNQGAFAAYYLDLQI